MKRLALVVACARRSPPAARSRRSSRRPASRCRSSRCWPRRTPTAEQLLTAAASAEPERVDELIKRRSRASADRFDLPPPDGGAAAGRPDEPTTPTTTEHPAISDPAMTQARPQGRSSRSPGSAPACCPATKAMPKEMLTIVDRPLIQYAVDEAREAGIEQMIFVTGRGKVEPGRLFRHRLRARSDDARRGKSLDALAPSRADFGEIVAVRQQQPLGLGHAVWCARHIVGDEPFAVLLPDDLMVGTARRAQANGRCLCRSSAAISSAPRKCRPTRPRSYGIITPGRSDGALTEVAGLVEKPKPEDAPSRLGVIGRYILQPEVMAHPRARARAAPAAKSS